MRSKQSAVLYTDFHDEFAVEPTDTLAANDIIEVATVLTDSLNSRNCIVDSSPVDGLEWNKVRIINGFIDHVIAFAHLEYMFQEEEISLLVPLALCPLFHIHNERIIRSYWQFHLTLVYGRIP